MSRLIQLLSKGWKYETVIFLLNVSLIRRMHFKAAYRLPYIVRVEVRTLNWWEVVLQHQTFKCPLFTQCSDSQSVTMLWFLHSEGPICRRKEIAVSRLTRFQSDLGSWYICGVIYLFQKKWISLRARYLVQHSGINHVLFKNTVLQNCHPDAGLTEMFL